MQIFEKICDIIKEHLHLEDDFIITEAATIQSLDADSLDLVEIIMGIEDSFDIEIPDGAEEKIHTVGDVVKLVEELLK